MLRMAIICMCLISISACDSPQGGAPNSARKSPADPVSPAAKQAGEVMYDGLPLRRYVEMLGDREFSTSQRGRMALHECPKEAAILCVEEIRRKGPGAENAAKVLTDGNVAKNAKTGLSILDQAVKDGTVTKKQADESIAAIKKWAK